MDNAILKAYGETVVGGAAGTNTGSTYTVDISTGNIFNLILNANCTFTFSNPTASGTACSFRLVLKQDATGSRLATWPASVAWPSNTTVTLSTLPASFDVIEFLTLDGGTTYFGIPAGFAYT